MISIRRCVYCGNYFDIDKSHPSNICEDCAEKEAESKTSSKNTDFWGEVEQGNFQDYFLPRKSGTLAFIEREGELPPEQNNEAKVDKYIADAIADFTERRQPENDIILSAFNKQKSKLNTSTKESVRPNFKEKPSASSKAQNDLLNSIFKK